MTSTLHIPVFTIDGGAATGKGTVCEKLAQRLGFHSFDSGNLYRALGLLCYRKHLISVDDIVHEAHHLDIKVDGNCIFLNGNDETHILKSQFGGQLAFKVAKVREVRVALKEFQLSQRKLPGLVTDGRDQGFIFENSFRYFFTIDPTVAAVRRVFQLKEMNHPAVYETILAEIIKRNMTDRERKVDPLTPHPEAEIIDTGGKTVEEIVNYIISHSKISM